MGTPAKQSWGSTGKLTITTCFVFGKDVRLPGSPLFAGRGSLFEQGICNSCWLLSWNSTSTKSGNLLGPSLTVSMQACISLAYIFTWMQGKFACPHYFLFLKTLEEPLKLITVEKSSSAQPVLMSTSLRVWQEHCLKLNSWEKLTRWDKGNQGANVSDIWGLVHPQGSFWICIGQRCWCTQPCEYYPRLLNDSGLEVQAIRLKEYPNYLNCKEEVEAARESIKAEAQFVKKVRFQYPLSQIAPTQLVHRRQCINTRVSPWRDLPCSL